MKIGKLLLITLILLGATSLPGITCELQDPNSDEYSLREDNSCEGIQKRINVSGSLDLVSITSTTGGDLEQNLQIRVPRKSNSKPYFQLQELSSRYMLRNVSFSEKDDFYTHQRSTRQMLRSGIGNLDDLMAIAVIGMQRTYLPTILGQPANHYRFVFYSVDTVQFVEASIRKGDKTHASWGSQGARKGKKTFTWNNIRNAPAGLYEFHYVAEIEQYRRAPEKITRKVSFWHDPNWVR